MDFDIIKYTIFNMVRFIVGIIVLISISVFAYSQYLNFRYGLITLQEGVYWVIELSILGIIVFYIYTRMYVPIIEWWKNN